MPFDFSGRRLAIIAAAFAILLGVSPITNAQGRDPTAHPAIAEAVAKARDSLPEFMERWRSNDIQDTGYALKVAIGDQNGVEHLWVTGLQRRDGRIFGVIDTRPMRVRSHAAGQQIEIKPDSIVDWMFFRRGRMVGNHTGRAMLPYLPAPEAEKLRLLFE
ncbi:MAG: DUF2314 domain-containing protein [Alphaproteobacteria bacterium]|nr:DUF2314 domain-containing protein [Alphaproteobacteria bacterium]